MHLSRRVNCARIWQDRLGHARPRPWLAAVTFSATGLALAGSPLDASAAEEYLPPPRPPQYIVVSFDNGREVRKWRDLKAWSERLERRGASAKFTFFVSAVNFLASQQRQRYQPPRLRSGRSNIGFGGSVDDVADRIDAINAIIADGHEFASHAVGHFQGGKGLCRGRRPGVSCGANWSFAEWQSEHAAFARLMLDVSANHTRPLGPLPNFAPDLLTDMIGFRAPHLSINRAMFKSLAASGFRYDASWARGAAPQAWPVRDETGLWLYKLPRLKVVMPGNGKRRRSTLAMDYNFCAMDSRRHGHDCLRINRRQQNRDRFGRQMLATYLEYFRQNYAGNRAPIHIGHHFSEFQAGTYHRALVGFVEAVCGMAEVRCVTYRTLTRVMNRLSAREREAFQNGQFERAVAPNFDVERIWDGIRVRPEVETGVEAKAGQEPRPERRPNHQKLGNRLAPVDGAKRPTPIASPALPVRREG